MGKSHFLKEILIIFWKGCTGISSHADIFSSCTTELCPCVSTAFSHTSSEANFRSAIDDFFNKFHSYYGTNVQVTKTSYDNSGTTWYKFKATFTYALNAASFDEVFLYQKNTSDSTTKTLTLDTDYKFTYVAASLLTQPLQGNFRIKVTNGSTPLAETDDINPHESKGQVLRKIYEKLPILMGKLEIRDSYNTYYSGDEGRELFWRFAQDFKDFTLEIIDSATTPLNIPNFSSNVIDIANPSDYMPASKKPFYEVIPGAFLRTVETTPQVTVSTNGITGACPTKGACGFTFSSVSGSISAYEFFSSFPEIKVTGTSIPTSTVEYVSFGNCICDLHPSYTVKADEIHCIMRDCPSGDYKAYVQTSGGALTNSGSNDFTIPMVMSNVIPTELYSSGGQTVTITGTNFPSSLTHANSFSDFAVEFSDGKACVVTSVTTTQILCTAPAGLTGSTIDLTLKFNSKSETKTGITVSTPANNVESIDKPSVSPVEKQDLVITADNRPSTTLTEYHGLLVSPTKTIKMKVNDIVQDGAKYKYTVRFPGAPKGDTYDVYLVHNDQRFGSTTTLSTVSTISALSIQGGSNNDVSTHGGNIVVLTGTAFSTDIEILY